MMKLIIFFVIHDFIAKSTFGWKFALLIIMSEGILSFELFFAFLFRALNYYPMTLILQMWDQFIDGHISFLTSFYWAFLYFDSLKTLSFDSIQGSLVRLLFTAIWAVILLLLPSLQALWVSNCTAVSLRAHLKFVANLKANSALETTFIVFN